MSTEALFSVGDGHGAQGDGEVCVTAIETGLIGTFELIVRDDMQPRVAARRDADARHDHGVRSRPRRLRGDRAAPDGGSRRRAAGITRQEAYALCSLAADLRITQVVNGSKGVHVMLDKRYLARAA